MSDNKERSNIALTVGCLSAVAVIIAAIIGLGSPFAERAADLYFPTFTPVPNNPPINTSAPIELPTQAVVAPVIPQIQPTSVSVPQTDCSKMIEGEHHFPTLGVEWRFNPISENRIIHIWSNHWENNLPEYKFFLPAGQSVSFMSGGGSFWTEKPGCNGVAQVIYDRDALTEISFEEYQKYIQQRIIP